MRAFAAPGGLRPKGSFATAPTQGRPAESEEKQLSSSLEEQQQRQQQQQQQQQQRLLSPYEAGDCLSPLRSSASAAELAEAVAAALEARLLPQLLQAATPAPAPLPASSPACDGSVAAAAATAATAAESRLQAAAGRLEEALGVLGSSLQGLEAASLTSRASRSLLPTHQATEEADLEEGGLRTRRSASKVSELEKISNSCPTARLKRVNNLVYDQRALRRSFVVNFRRLVQLQKVFAIIHELIKSTAIAALTLVLASNVWELCYSVMFVAILFVIYGFHAAHYDTMDISDYRSLSELLEDDDGVVDGRQTHNPNRLLKALTLARTGRRRRALLIIVGFGVICVVMWSMVLVQWSEHFELTGIWSGFLAGEFYATLLLVGTLMLIFHIVFEWLYWRETQCVMPAWDKSGAEPWNPRKHGIPRRYAWFGLPSMWFASADTYEDLGLWIQKAQGTVPRKASKLFPEELAMFALDASGACRLRSALLHAKLYCMQQKSFLLQQGHPGETRTLAKGEEPEELGINLVFFDSLSKEFLQPEEDYLQGQVHVLCSACSGSGESLGTKKDLICGFAEPVIEA